ncbi:MAG: GAF domain-containing protein [Bacteroidaceae bacterium]|nr:GAF domain-containing protein [Bacteroidaceae bacterium]
MSEVNFNITAVDKAGRYEQFLEQVKPCIQGETYEVSLLANVSAALKEVFDFFWVGFYLVKDNHLILGPFQGSMACSIIKYGKGVCGTAWKENLTQVVPDVEQFPGHIACSSLSRSEIVVPMAVAGEVKGVLDIDSTELATFDETDKLYLEQLVNIIINTMYV